MFVPGTSAETIYRRVCLLGILCPCQVMVVNANKVARSLAFTFQSPAPCLSGINPPNLKSMPLALSTAPSDTFYPSSAVLQHTKQKSAGMANFSCIWYWGYSTSTSVNPEEGKTCVCVCVCFEDGLPDHIMRKEAYEQAAISGEGPQSEQSVWGERNTDAHLVRRLYFHVKYFRPQAKSHSLSHK